MAISSPRSLPRHAQAALAFYTMPPATWLRVSRVAWSSSVSRWPGVWSYAARIESPTATGVGLTRPRLPWLDAAHPFRAGGALLLLVRREKRSRLVRRDRPTTLAGHTGRSSAPDDRAHARAPCSCMKASRY